MLASAMNFAIGFFGYPFDGMYEQSITIESHGVSFFLPLNILILISTLSSIIIHWHPIKRNFVAISDGQTTELFPDARTLTNQVKVIVAFGIKGSGREGTFVVITA
jgi:hypothetical protein